MTLSGENALIHAVRWPVVACYLGQLALILVLLTVPPLAVSMYYGDQATNRYLFVMAFLLAVGWPLSRRRAPDRIQGNEAMVIVTLAFVLSPLMMTWPLAAAGLSPMDAFFEAVSGMTTTGLSTVAAVREKGPAFLFARAWMQWYGGLGIAVLAAAAMAQHGLVTRKLVDPTGSGVLASSTRLYARRVLSVYVTLTLFGGLLIWAAGMEPFDAVAHVLAAISTGGFSTFDQSLAGTLPPLAPIAVLFVCFLGAVSLSLYAAAWHRGVAELLNDLEFRALSVVCLAVAMLLSLWLWRSGLAFPQALWQGGLLAVSAQTTAGFSPMFPLELDDFAKGLLILSMVVGGSLGSTAGGVKLLRVLILLRLVQNMLRRTAVPEHAVVTATLRGQIVREEEMTHALLIMALFAVVAVLSWLLFLAQGYPALDSLFEVVSAVGTVGLSSGVSGSQLPDTLKLVLCFDMLAGRLEVVALLVALYPATWIGGRREA